MSSLWFLNPNLPRDSQSYVNSSDLKEGLLNAQNYLKHQFELGVDIVKLIQLRANFVDQAISIIWQQHLSAHNETALIAVGGYGRGELHPYSDIDLLILVEEDVLHQLPQELSDFLTQLWDIGLEIGHSVRTLTECRQEAEKDITTATNLLETRLLSGSITLYSALQKLTVSSKTWDEKAFFHKKLLEQQNRHKKYNNTANNLEPNLKESPGGIRDLNVISWIAQQHFGVRDLHGLYRKGFIAQNEYELLNQAQNFLWKVRFALHFEAERKQETLLIDLQRALAKKLGYTSDDKRLAVEYFMKDYYLCARQVRQMNELLVQLFQENIVEADQTYTISKINRRFQSHGDYLETINAGIFAYYPYSLLELFLILQQNPKLKGIRASTIRQVYAHIHLIDDRFRQDIKNQSLFMEIIRQSDGIADQFSRMNQIGVLGAYLPSFGAIVGQMQHDLFHVYTVDEHTLFLTRNIQRFSQEEFQDELPLCTKVFSELPKPEILYIAALFHDIAKGRGGDHSKLGVADAAAFCEQHSISPLDTDLVSFLVLYHLLMSKTAQRRDIYDPEVIERFARTVQTVDRLNYLYLLTVADIRSTNDNLWNGWQDSLLSQLYSMTKSWLERQDNVAEAIPEKIEQNRYMAMTQLTQNNWSSEEISRVWSTYDQDYFLRYDIAQIVRQTELRLNYDISEDLVQIRQFDQEGTSEIFIITRNAPRVFAVITIGLEQLQLNILDAKLNVTEDNLLLQTYIVNGSKDIHHATIQDNLMTNLRQLEEAHFLAPVYRPRKMRLFKAETTISFEANESQNHSTLKIYTHDRPGLISTIAQVFLKCSVGLINAKLTTLVDQVEDVFLITNSKQRPLNSVEKIRLSTELEFALDQDRQFLNTFIE